MNEVKPINEISEDANFTMDKTNQKLDKPEDWKAKFFEMGLLSPIYVFLFIVLFMNGKDEADLHDAIIHFILTYNN